jgi:hypothetical protein
MGKLAVGFALVLAGCGSWREFAPGQPVPDGKTIWSLRVFLRDSNHVDFKKAQFMGDSLIGVTQGESGTRVAVARANIEKIWASRFDIDKTAALLQFIPTYPTRP